MLELLLKVETGPMSATDVIAELGDDHRVVDLAATLARHLNINPADRLVPHLACQRLGYVLDPEQTVLDSGLLSGDVVRLGVGFDSSEVAANTASGGMFCDVTSGPGSGTSIPVHPGWFTIGREPGCDLQLHDPTVSKRHAVLHVDHGGGVEVEPVPEATNPVVIDGTPIGERTPLPLGSVLQLGSCALTVRDYQPTAGAERDQLGQIPFNRTPYRHPDLSEVEVRGPGRPPKPHEPRPLRILAMIAPVIAGFAFAYFLQRWIFLMFVLLSPISMLANWYSEKKRSGVSYKEQVEAFEKKFDSWVARYDEDLAVERKRRYEASPDVADLARRAQLRTADLWPRSRRSDGFLHLRLGLGGDDALSTSKRPDGADTDPDGRIEEVIDERAELASVPIDIDLVEHGVVAVHGAHEEVETTVGSLIVQATSLHSPDDLVLCTALGSRRTLDDWVKWLPHTRTVSSPLAGSHLAVGADEADELLRRLIEVASEREEEAWPRMLVVLDEHAGADHLLISTLLEGGPALGIYAVWMGDGVEHVPRQATAIMDCPPVGTGKRAKLWFTDSKRKIRKLDPDRIGLEAAPRVARSLAPVRDSSSASATASIPRIAPLLETLGTASIDAGWVATSWKQKTEYGLAAPIGIGPSGPFVIDLVEHGPHGLIAGTSGAGKSELLQSHIASLIANYPPNRLNFLFIDYKGGASSSIFQPAPHTVGYVTNLGADLAMRALVSLQAELDRRMQLLEGRAKDLEEMLEKFPDETPASLVIVVDEFATLVKEIPDFVAGMVDVAQRGRSLGIHLILATQRPTGAVNDNILANTNLRISLRVLDPQDSNSILGTTDAAAIPAPLRGRGFAKLGAGALVEFQSGFSGATFTADSGTTPVVVENFPPDGATTVHPEPPKKTKEDEEEETTHLQVLMDAVVKASKDLGMERGRRPWIEDLPRHVDLASVEEGAYGELPERVAGRELVLGAIDEPRYQRQRPYLVDLEAEGGLLIFGTGGSGKSTVLRTLMASAMADATPADVNMYILDYAGRALESLRDLPHVSAVATGEDPEQTTRILQHLRAEVGRRQQMLSEHRAENLTALNAARPDNPVPRLLLMIDSFESFDRAFERGQLYLWSELLVETVLAGRSVGLHLVATAGRRVSVPSALSNAISGRVVLRTADNDGLMDLGIPGPIAKDASLGDGRAMIPPDKTIQIAVPGPEVSNAGQTEALEERSKATGAGMDVTLPQLPDVVETSELPDVKPAEPMSFPLGLADLTLDPVWCDIRLQHFAIIGPSESGRSTALHIAATQLEAAGTDVWVVADPASPLGRHGWGKLAAKRDQIKPMIEELGSVAKRCDSEGKPAPVLVLDRAEMLPDDAGRVLEPLLQEDLVRLVGGFEPTALTGYVSGWAGQVKGTRRMLLLQPDDMGDLTALTPVRLRLRPGQTFPPGRGVFISNRNWQLVQVAQNPSVAGGDS